MKGIFLIVVGLLLVAGGATGLIHPQWVGPAHTMPVEIDVKSSAPKQVIVTTRRVTDIPRLFSVAVIVAGLCTTALGGIALAKERSPN